MRDGEYDQFHHRHRRPASGDRLPDATGRTAAPLLRQDRLIDALTHGFGAPSDDTGPSGDRSRIGVDFGSIGLCHVASAATDAFIEFAQGFALWDLLPGRFILETAGRAVCDLGGEPLLWPTTVLNDATPALDRRETFIAAGSHALARKVADVLTENGPRP